MNIENNISQISGRKFLLAIILLGILLRLFSLNSPFLDHGTVLQTILADTARAFYQDGRFNFLFPYRHRLNPDGLPMVDIVFPINQFLASLLYRLVGVREWAARLIPISFYVGCLILFYRLAKKFISQTASLFACLFFTIAPENIFIGRAFMPESSMLFFSVGMIFFFSQWLDSKRWKDFLWTWFFSAFAFLAKPVSLFFIIPMLYLAIRNFKAKAFINWKLYLLLVLGITPYILWAFHSYNLSGRISFVEATGQVSSILNLKFWLRMYESITLFMLTPLGFLLFLAGLVLPVKKRGGFIFHFWVLAVLIFILCFSGMHFPSYHYQVVIIPAASIFIGKMFSFLLDRDFARYTFFGRFISSRIAIGILICLILLSSIIIISPQYKCSDDAHKAGKAIDALAEKDALVIAGIGFENGLLYYTNRKGWLTYEEEKIDEIESLRAQGADYYITTVLNKERKDKRLLTYLLGKYELVSSSDDYIIFDIR